MAAIRYPFTIYLVDTSVIARRDLPSVRDALAELRRAAELGTCPLIIAEVCYSARNLAEYRALRELMGGMILINSDDQVEEAALAAQQALAARRQHRTSVVDLFAAATAAAHDAVLLHYDSDYERIGTALGARTKWVVEQGTL